MAPGLMHTRRRIRQRVIAFAPRVGTLRWIMEELDGEPYKVMGVRSIVELVAALKQAMPPGHPIAIADFDTMTEADICELEDLRKANWGGVLIGLGHVERDVRLALRVSEVVMRPFGSERLRKSLSEADVDRTTQQIQLLQP